MFLSFLCTVLTWKRKFGLFQWNFIKPTQVNQVINCPCTCQSLRNTWILQTLSQCAVYDVRQWGEREERKERKKSRCWDATQAVHDVRCIRGCTSTWEISQGGSLEERSLDTASVWEKTYGPGHRIVSCPRDPCPILAECGDLIIPPGEIIHSQGRKGLRIVYIIPLSCLRIGY